MAKVVNIYPYSSYFYEHEGTATEMYKTDDQRLERRKEKYMREGMRTSVEGVLLVHLHNHPHVLLMKLWSSIWKLPGGSLHPGENEIEGLKRKLKSKLAVNSPSLQPEWQIGECIADWWRPNFERVLYPYCPPHITKPKEHKKLFIVHLPERADFEVTRSFRLVAAPFLELHSHRHSRKYGKIISAIPAQLSSFQLNMITP